MSKYALLDWEVKQMALLLKECFRLTRQICFRYSYTWLLQNLATITSQNICECKYYILDVSTAGELLKFTGLFEVF